MIFHEGKEPLFLSLLAFLITFASTRGYTRLARSRHWGSGSIVVGIVFVRLAK
jgi:hypothetical protein